MSKNDVFHFIPFRRDGAPPVSTTTEQRTTNYYAYLRLFRDLSQFNVPKAFKAAPREAQY